MEFLIKLKSNGFSWYL